jgi:hypothetical protein
MGGLVKPPSELVRDALHVGGAPRRRLRPADENCEGRAVDSVSVAAERQALDNGSPASTERVEQRLARLELQDVRESSNHLRIELPLVFVDAVDVVPRRLSTLTALPHGPVHPLELGDVSLERNEPLPPAAGRHEPGFIAAGKSAEEC